ncbi:triple QxxK/R motif-containing protein-like [Panulirus ornatus]|uniref:triple QxxK/R motif-containing protein-like n=1 Tax=Panulirus ornatus TaxID=150431 RepID=UPI003A864620
MGRKDSQMHSIPIDHYRKQIGKQYKKQTNTNIREMKKHSESKSSTSKVYQDVRMVISGFAAVIVVVYSILYFWLYDDKPAN